MSDHTHDPFTGARLHSRDVDPAKPRYGVPADKFGMSATPPFLTPDGRQGVMLLLFPPEELRDQSLETIELVVSANGKGLLKSVALEIYKSFTSDPIDASNAQNVITALQSHVNELKERGR
jgi:hypothetical protein